MEESAGEVEFEGEVWDEHTCCELPRLDTAPLDRYAWHCVTTLIGPAADVFWDWGTATLQVRRMVAWLAVQKLTYAVTVYVKPWKALSRLTVPL